MGRRDIIFSSSLVLHLYGPWTDRGRKKCVHCTTPKDKGDAASPNVSPVTTNATAMDAGTSPQRQRTTASGGRGVFESDIQSDGDSDSDHDSGPGPGRRRSTDSVECLRCRGCRQRFADPVALKRHSNSRYMRGTPCAIQASKKARRLVSTWRPGHSHQAAGAVDEPDDSEPERNQGGMDIMMDAGDNVDEPVDANAPVRVSHCKRGDPGPGPQGTLTV